MSNSFLKGFGKKKSNKYELEEKVIFLSEQLKEILGVSDEILQSMNAMDYSMYIGKLPNNVSVTLKVTNKCFSDGWVYVIEALPTSYAVNDIDNEYWISQGGGTSLAMLPRESDQVLILELAKKL